MATQAVKDAMINNDVSGSVGIYSRKIKSPLYGAQYLHRPIPNFTPERSHLVDYMLHGDANDYRRKVYGNLWDGTVSAEELLESHRAWDIRATYDMLWDAWHPYITDGYIDTVWLMNMLASDKPDLVINSIPRPALCRAGHNFGSTNIWAAGDAPALGISIPYRCIENTVVCDGTDNVAWYRMSNVFGHTTVEWPGSLTRVPVNTASVVQKPTSHNCDCWPEFLHVGRYGEWAKGVLSHTAYFNTYKKIEQMIGVRVASEQAEA